MKQILAVVLFTALVATLHAQAPVARPESDAALVDTEFFSLQSAFSYSFSGDFKDDALGDVESYYASASVAVPIPLGESFRLVTGVSYEYLGFDAEAAFVPDRMQGLSGIAGLEYLVNGKPVIFLRSSPGVYFIDSPDSDSFDIPTVFYAAYRFSPSFIGIAGATYTGFRSDYPVLPIAGFMWDVTDAVKFNAILPVASIDFTLNEAVTLSLIGQFVGLNVHTAEDLEDPVYHDTELGYTELRAGASVSFQVFGSSRIRVAGGWAFRQEFEFEDPDDEFRTDGAPFVSVSFRGKF